MRLISLSNVSAFFLFWVFASNTGFFSVFPYSWVFIPLDSFFSYFMVGAQLARPLAGCSLPWSTFCYEAPYLWLDFAGLALLVVFFYAVWRESAFLRALSKTSLMLAVLPVMVMAADYREFFQHVTDAQEYLNFMPWFSNADLLASCCIVYVTTVTISKRHYNTGSGIPKP